MVDHLSRHLLQTGHTVALCRSLGSLGTGAEPLGSGAEGGAPGFKSPFSSPIALQSLIKRVESGDPEDPAGAPEVVGSGAGTCSGSSSSSLALPVGDPSGMTTGSEGIGAPDPGTGTFAGNLITSGSPFWM